MICELVRAGKKVGVSRRQPQGDPQPAGRGVEGREEERHARSQCVQKVGDEARGRRPDHGGRRDNAEVLDSARERRAQRRRRHRLAVGARGVSEARRRALRRRGGADVARERRSPSSQAAQSLVLLGDPQQLEQPSRAATRRARPSRRSSTCCRTPDDRRAIAGCSCRRRGGCARICEFTSELFYEGRLQLAPGSSSRCLDGTRRRSTAPVSGSCRSSTTGIRTLDRGGGSGRRHRRGRCSAAGSRWIDREGESQSRSTPSDILVVAPYNAQVARSQERLPRGARVGTVDRFQGQEAPVVIYSMATSTPEDAPRGMEFLYSPNRLNVATSRAQMRVHPGREPAAVRARVPDAAADAAGERVLPVSRDGDGRCSRRAGHEFKGRAATHLDPPLAGLARGCARAPAVADSHRFLLHRFASVASDALATSISRRASSLNPTVRWISNWSSYGFLGRRGRRRRHGEGCQSMERPRPLAFRTTPHNFMPAAWAAVPIAGPWRANSFSASPTSARSQRQSRRLSLS